MIKSKIISDFMEENYFINKLLYLYILFIPIMILKNKYHVQISDFIFLLIFFVFFLRYFEGGITIGKIPLAVPIFLYLGTSMLSVFNSNNYSASLLELSKMVYLVLIFILIVTITKNENQIKLFINTWLIATAVAIFLGIVGVIAAYGFHILSPFVEYYDNYPYVGKIFRPLSTLKNAKMLSSYFIPGMTLSLSLLFIEKDRLKRNLLSLLIVSILILMLFSLSRGILGLGIGIFIVLLKHNKEAFKKLKLFFGIGLVFLFLLINILTTWYFISVKITHSIDKENTIPANTMVFIEPHTGAKKIMLDVEYVDTNYFRLKKIALKMLKDNPLIGIGIGTFNDRLKSLESSKKNPSELSLFDPHSTFLGKLAETGIIGFSMLILLLGASLKKLILYYKAIEDNYWKTIIWGVFAAFVAFIFEGINMDIMNFRFLWAILGLGLVIGKVLSEQKQSSASFNSV